MARFHVIAAVLAAVLVVAFAEESVYDVRPDAIHAFIGNEKIEICGCGFTKYNSVVCIFNGQWMSTNSWIVDDNTVICQAPAFPKEYFIDNLAQDFAVHVVYDNDDNSAIYVGNIRVGPQVNTDGQQISPQYTRRTNAGTLTISGSLFRDNWDSPPTVYFDDVAVNVSDSSYTDTTISVAIPNGKLNQNAMISVRFHAGGYSFYMKVDDTLRYGPWVTSITQTCVDPEGGTQLTVTGHNLDDTTTGNDGTLPLIIVSYYDDEKQTVADKPNYNFQISLLANSGLTANSFTFAAPSIVEALQAQNPSENDAFNLAWGIYVEVDIYFDQSWARSTMETGEPLYFLTDADLQNSNLLDNIGDEQPQTLGYRYGGYIIQSAGVTVGGTRASTLSVPGSFAHFGGGDQVCIQFCGTNLLNKFGTVNNGYSWEFFYHYDAAPSSESICTSAPTLTSTDTFCCTTDVSTYANRCTNGLTTEFSATLTINSDAGDLLGSNAVYDSDDAKLENIYADVAYSSSLWLMSLGPQQVSTVQGLFGRSREYRFDFANIDASTSITYDVYAAQYNRGGSTPWPFTLSSVYSQADGNPTQTSGTFTIQSDTSVSVTVPAFDFDITNVLNLNFDSGKTCVNQYVHWGSICGPWYLDKDNNGQYYSNPAAVFDNFDINDYGLSTNYVGLGTSTAVGITVKSGQNTGHSDRVILCARGSFTDSIEEGFTWSDATSRFNDNNGGGTNIPSSCDVYQASTGGTNVATLPANNNILWADQYDVWQYYSVADDQLYSGYTSAYTNVQDFDGSSTSTVWKARTLCGRIRVGCTATDAECSSPYGPTQGFYELNADGSAPEDASAGPSSTIGSVTVTGKFMDESADPEIAILGYSTSKTLAGNSGGLTAGSQWNKDALVTGAVSVVCDICNTTDPSEIFRVRFGPQIISLDIDSDGQGYGDTASSGVYNGYDLWGASNLVDVSSYLTIRGYRFSDYIIGSDGMYNYNNGADNLAEFYNSDEVAITVFVDGVQAEFNSLWIPQSSTVEVQEILVTLPTRPFGTAGVVKVYFGQQYHNPEEIRFYEYASNWGHYLIASQKVWYTPRIDLVDVTGEPRFGYAAGAHGLTEITATGLGFLDAYDDDVYCYLDDYVVPGEVVTDTRTVSCTFDEGAKKRMNIIPDEYQKPESFQYKFGAEFNTNVSFHIEFNRETDELQYLPTYSYGYLNDGNNNEYSDGLDDDYGAVYNSLGVHDLKVLYDGDVFHWGPICTATSQDPDTLYYTVSTDFTNQNDVVISGSYMSDCLADQNDGDTILESPWTVNADSDNSVTYTYCQARYVDIYMVWEGVNGQTYTLTLTEAADSLDSDTFHFASDDLSPANIAAESRTTSGSQGTTISNMECNFEGWFYVVYTDAHVTNPFQQNIYCEKQYTISAPYVTAVDGDDGSGPTGWGHAVAGALDDLPWFFGWVDNEIVATFSENLVTNDYLGAATCHWAFDGSSTVSATGTTVGTTVTCAFPASGNWQNTGVLSISFDNGGDNTLLASCSYTIARFTYGPGVLHHNYCASPFGLDCGGSASTTVTFSAYGPTCCNLGTASNAIFGAGYTADRKTWSVASNHGVQTISVLQPGTENSCDSTAKLTSSSFIPLSSLGPIGVVFYKSGATPLESPASNGQCSSNVYCLFDTVDGAGYNQVCFGPIRESDTELVRYTYTAYGTEASTEDESYTFPVLFDGVDDLSSDFSSVEVDFCYASGQCINDLLTAESDTDSADTIVVDLFDAVYTPGADTNDDITTFTVQCGDAYNYVRFQFQYNNVKYIVKDTFAATGTATSSSPQFFAQTGNEVRITLDHRPKIKSVTPACGYSQLTSFTNPLACTNADDGIIRSSEYGNLILDVTISNAYDFFQRGQETESTENFGNFGVIAYLGSQDGSNFVSRAFITDTTSGTYEKASEIAGQDWSEFVYTDGTDNNGDVTIRIVLPPGAFNSELFLHAEYNPHIDDFTSTYDDFLWVPYVTAVSKTWVLPRGHENLAYQGHGFTGSEQEEDGPLHTVLQVSNSFRTGVELQASCRIYKDQYITCLTPAFSTSSTTQSADIQFTSCDDDICGDAWTIPSNQNIDIVGTVAIAPQTISNDGGTVVYFPFYGMSHFATEQIFCGFPDLQSVDHEWLFPVVYNSSNVAFNKPVYECFIPDIQGLTVNNATVITTLNLYFQEPTVAKCDDVDQPFLVTLSTHPVQVGFPCAREAEFTPAANNNDDNTYSGFGVVVVPNLRNKNGVVSVRGDFFPEVNGTTGAASPVDFRCRFEYYNWRAYYDPENRDNGNHYHYRNVLSDLASGPNTYTLVVNGAVEVYAEQWDCTLPESNGDDRDFDVIVVTAVYRGLEDDNCHVVLLNSAAAFASSLVVLLVALAALF